ncbi:unnamed protein product [Urochloa humidicola]
MGFEDLNPDLVRLICSHLPCRLDRGNMAAVCPSWRDAIAPPLLPEQAVEQAVPGLHSYLPILLIPRSAAASSCCVLCRGDGGGQKMGCIPEGALQARFFGSYDNSWLMLARYQTEGHGILSLRTGNLIDLPDCMNYEHGDEIFEVVIEAATLSAAPESDECVAAALVHRRTSRGSRVLDLMFWPFGKGGIGWGLEHHAIKPNRIEDIIFFNDAFYALDLDEQLVVIHPDFNNWFMTAEVEERHLEVGHNYHPESVLRRYLIQSRGELLMVTRCCQQAGFRPYTSSYKVFRMEQLQGGGNVWAELPSLDGRILYVARGCSRAYEVGNHPNGVEGVYFKGDTESWSSTWDEVPVQLYREKMDDQGVWLGPPLGPIVPCFALPEEMRGHLDYLPPVWVLPATGGV